MALEDQPEVENKSGTLPLSNSPAQESSNVRRFKRRLLGKDRPWISWRKSAQAIVLSSCMFPLNHPFLLRVPSASTGVLANSHSLAVPYCRDKRLDPHHPHCLGIPLERMGTRSHLYSYVITTIYSFSVSWWVHKRCFQCVSSPS